MAAPFVILGLVATIARIVSIIIIIILLYVSYKRFREGRNWKGAAMIAGAVITYFLGWGIQKALFFIARQTMPI